MDIKTTKDEVGYQGFMTRLVRWLYEGDTEDSEPPDEPRRPVYSRSTEKGVK